jgi:hypothetical protein
VEKCVGCHYYDRPNGKQTDSRGIQWAQCRRHAPMLHPINQKSFMIEGVWPHVRDDDWCGEWKAATRRVDVRQNEAVAPGPLLPVGGASPFAPRPAAKIMPQPGVPLAASSPTSVLASSGRGD